MELPQKPILYAENVTKYRDPDAFAAAYALLPPCRREKVDRLRFEKDKCLSLGAGILLRQALTEAGLPCTEQDAVFGEQGKPCFPHLADRFQFSLSHSGEFAMCAVLPARGEIGCDLEQLRDIRFRVPKHYFAESEYETIMREPTQETKQQRFFRIWVLKESFLKATGLGLSLPMRDFEIDFDAADKPLIRQHVDRRHYRFEEIPVSDGYACAVCVALPEER